MKDFEGGARQREETWDDISWDDARVGVKNRAVLGMCLGETNKKVIEVVTLIA
jgi:hypothetical protein